MFEALNHGKGRSLTQLALLFCIANPSVSSVIPGMLRTDEVLENMAVSSLNKLTSSELDEIRNIYKENLFYDPTSKDA